MTPAADPDRCTLDVLSSEELACRAQAGSLPSFAELVGRYQSRLYNFLLRRVGNTSDAEDIAQETFVRAWQRIGQYHPKWRFSTWLYTIGSRLAINHHRAVSRRREKCRSDAGLERMPDGEGDPARELADREAREAIWDIASRLLSPDQLSMLWLRYAEDLSAGEIARVLGKSRVAVRVSLHRAKQRIAEVVEHEEQLTRSPPRDQQPTQVIAAKPVAGGVS